MTIRAYSAAVRGNSAHLQRGRLAVGAQAFARSANGWQPGNSVHLQRRWLAVGAQAFARSTSDWRPGNSAHLQPGNR
ncbi:hypothetical protein [Erwinia sp. B116]|uniref:hypothetical protein n=1 Tax=Erwinia sp. B116 TaxID=1561024 RepID=UPI000C768455|nr:hypothetical protein [Erwinia sp. B116]PLV55977.1 hypothetical protein NV64_16760 [Erwinia sp. B116]